MKKSIVFLSCVAILMVGCAKVENEVDVLEKGTHQVTLKAYVDEADTRISADASGKFSWQAGDRIVVLTDDSGSEWVETEDSGETASFDVTLPEGVNLGQYAFYPAAEGCGVSSDNEINFGLEPTYDYVKDATNMPMLGTISSEGVFFKAVGGVLKLIIYNVPEEAALLQFSTNDMRITGDFLVSGGAIAAEEQESGDAVTFNFTGNRETNMVFYIPLPTGTINGFELSFLKEDYTEIEGATKSTTATLNVTRNKMIIAPALNCLPAENVVLWSEDFSSYEANNVPESGVGYKNATVSYDVSDGTGNGSTKIYADALAGGTSPEILIAKSNGALTVSKIPSAGASSAVLSFVSNKTSISVSSETEGVTVTKVSSTSYKVTFESTVQSFDLTITNTGSQNARFDDFLLEATIGAAPVTPVIETLSGESATIGAGSLSASINGIKLTNPLDNQGIVASTDANWLDVAFTEGSFDDGAKLTATAKSYNHESEARTAVVTLKATGVTKTVTFKQNPSVVGVPTLSVEPGNKTFTVKWTGDSKVASYVAYYSTNTLDNPTTGTALTVSNNGTAFTAVPSGELVNETTYHVYVKASALKDDYKDKYIIAGEWANGTVTPVGINGSVENPYSAAEAIAVMETLNNNEVTSEFYYVAGTLDAAPSYYSNGKLTFTFVDENDNQIKAYNCLGLNGSSFSSKDDLKVGDQVVVYGNLEKYVKEKDGVTTTEFEIVNGQLAKLTPYVAPDAIAVENQTFTFSELGYSNQQAVSDVSGSHCSISFSDGSKYYNTGTAIRVYGGGSITITADSGYKITSIKFTFGSGDGSNTISANSGTYTDGTWNGTIAGGSVQFSVSGTSGHRRISSIEIN